MMDVCDIVIETPEMHSRPEVARYIEQEVARPSKTWIHAVLEGRQEKDDVVHDSRDFLLLPDTERRQWPERSLNWLGIVKVWRAPCSAKAGGRD